MVLPAQQLQAAGYDNCWTCRQRQEIPQGPIGNDDASGQTSNGNAVPARSTGSERDQRKAIAAKIR